MAALIKTIVLIISASSTFAATSTNNTACLSSNLNFTTVEHKFPATKCFDCGSGVSRLDAGTAAETFCDYYRETTFIYGSPNTGGTYNGGNIMMSVIPFWDELGCSYPGDPIRSNDFFADPSRCHYDFMTPIDYCNTGGVNGKQGGTYWDDCANITINPNPDGCSHSDGMALGSLHQWVNCDVMVEVVVNKTAESTVSEDDSLGRKRADREILCD